MGAYRYTLAYYNVDWSDMQANLSCTGLALLCVLNVGDAESKGIEADVRGQVTQNLDVSASYTYNDSELQSLSSDMKEFIADGTAFASVTPGARLPGVSKHTVYLGLGYNSTLNNGLAVRYGLNGSYRSTAESSLNSDSYKLDSFWLLNTNVSLLAERWSASLYLNNIADERGLTGADPATQWGEGANAAVSLPRTLGVRMNYTF